MDAQAPNTPYGTDDRIGVLEELLNERYSVRAFQPQPVPRETINRLLTAAQRTASVTLGNSASTLSPAVLAMRPRWRPIASSRIARWLLRIVSVPSSSAAARRVNPSTSAAKIAANFRWISTD